MKRVFFLLLAGAQCLAAGAQQSAARQSYEAFRRQALAQYDAFRAKAVAEYIDFMRQAWQRFEAHDSIPRPRQEVTPVPPQVMPDEERRKPIEDRPLTMPVVRPQRDEAPAPRPYIAPAPVAPVLADKRVDVVLYGTACPVRADKSQLPTLRDTGEGAVADMWASLEASVESVLADCLAQRAELDLCDWAYLKLTQNVATALYAAPRTDERVVAEAYLLTRSGFKVRLARDTASHLHLLVAASCDLFGYTYFTIDGDHYFLLDKCGERQLYIFDQPYPQEHAMRLFINEENRFAEKISDDRLLQSKAYAEARATVSVNENLMAFYSSYPSAVVNQDPMTKWSFYASAPLSAHAKARLYPSLRAAIAGKSELEAANILLNFVQTAFVYEYDDKVWGCDRAFFADETLYYPFCDCEDRAILYHHLVSELMGLRVALVYYPGHLATAVCFSSPVAGDYITVDDRRFTICDPTYINAPVGRTMPGMNNEEAHAIL
jgi:hypothetical protein